MGLPDIDEALGEVADPRRQKLKMLAWVESLQPEEQEWVWGVFEKGYIRGSLDCTSAFRVIQKHLDPPEMSHQSMKRGVDAHFAGRR